jgi:hypothetical protein
VAPDIDPDVAVPVVILDQELEINGARAIAHPYFHVTHPRG